MQQKTCEGSREKREKQTYMKGKKNNPPADTKSNGMI